MSSSGIYISLPADILEEIDSRCGGPSLAEGKKRTGTSGGRAAWVRGIIYEALEREVPMDPHQKRKLDFQELVVERAKKRKCDDWKKTVTRAKDLRKEGLSLRQVAEILRLEKHATKRGGKWTAQTVRNILLNET